MTDKNTELENAKKLATKVEEMAQAIGTINKDGTNTHSHYNFVSHEAVTNKVSELSLANKISIRPDCKSYDDRDVVTSAGKAAVRSTVMMDFKVTDLETGYTEVHGFPGAETDTGGKSMQQAITQATKYFYFKLFKIPFGDDGDSKTVESGTKASAPKEPDTREWFNDYNQNTDSWKDETRQALLDMKTAGKTPEEILKAVQDKYKVSKAAQEAIKKLTQ